LALQWCNLYHKPHLSPSPPDRSNRVEQDSMCGMRPTRKNSVPTHIGIDLTRRLCPEDFRHINSHKMMIWMFGIHLWPAVTGIPIRRLSPAA
jgi:hypothetical protein